MKKLLSLHNLFLLVVFCVPIYTIKMNVFGVPSNILEFLALIAIVSTITQERKRFSDRLLELPMWLLTGSILIVFGLLLSIFFNDNSLVGLGIFKGWFIVPMLFSFALYSTLCSALDLEKVLKSVYFSTATVGLIAVGYKILGITTYDNRLTAFYLSPNHLAMYLSPGVFLGIYFLLKEYFESKLSIKTFLHIFSLSIILLPLYFTYSYGAWIAIAISMMILGLILIGNKKMLLAFFSLLFVFFLTLFILQVGSQKFDGLLSSRSSMASRLTIWQVATHLIRDNPIVGMGPGNFQSAYLSLQKDYPPYLEWAVPQPHNVFLAFWLQAGLIGFIGFLLLLFFIFGMFWQLIRNKKNVALATPLLSFFLYTILHGLIDTTFWKNDLSYLFWIFAFLTLFLHVKHTSEAHQPLNDK